MNSLIAIVPIAAGAYVATNMDIFVLLVSLLARYRSHAGIVVAASVAPVEYLGFLGIVPISIGTYEL